MSAVCQFNQFGHCKFGSRCEKFHTIETCDSFPCVNRECDKRHPKLCQYFAVYGWCRFAGNCSFLHYDASLSNKRDHNASDETQKVLQTMAELREEVRTLRLDVDRLRNENRHLLEVVERLEKDGIKDPGHEDRHEFDDPIDEQEVEDWCAVLDFPTRDATERGEMIMGLIQFAEFLAEENSDDAYTRMERCGGLAKLKQLRSHANELIRNKAQDILEILTSSWTGSRESGATERDVAMVKKDQRATNPVSRRSGRGQHNSRKKH